MRDEKLENRFFRNHWLEKPFLCLLHKLKASFQIPLQRAQPSHYFLKGTAFSLFFKGHSLSRSCQYQATIAILKSPGTTNRGLKSQPTAFETDALTGASLGSYAKQK